MAFNLPEGFARLKFIFHSGKNPKWQYYICSILRRLIPRAWLQRRLASILNNAESRADYQYLCQRRDYYCEIAGTVAAGKDAMPLGDLKPKKPKVYYYDLLRYARYFPKNLRLRLLPGDITHVPDSPSIVKSRPLAENVANATLMKLDRVRHFIFVNDKLKWEDKKSLVLFRGKVGGKEARRQFMYKWFGHSIVDAGDVGRKPEREEWRSRKLTLFEQLGYKFIMAIEGNDVASNLKWIMSSNSIAVMPRPTCETWFMEGTLIPGYHYVEVKPDFSDLNEKVEHYLNNPEEAKAIISHANEYVEQFRDKSRENIISLMTLGKYLDSINAPNSK